MPPRLSVADAEALEGNTGNRSLMAHLQLSAIAANEVTVQWRTSARTATANTDFVEASGLATIAVGSNAVDVPISVIGDSLLESDETFDFEIVSATGARIARNVALMTIRDDEQCPGPNLLANGSAELPMLNNEIPGWNEIKGNEWRAWAAPPQAAEGSFSFDAGNAAADGTAELRQDVSLTPYASVIDAGQQQFVFSGALRTLTEQPGDLARVVIEYLNADGSAVLSQYDSGELSSPDSWLTLSDQRLLPVGTRKARVRLLARKVSAAELDAWFDNLNLHSIRVPTLSLADARVSEANANATLALNLSCSLHQNLTVGYTTANGSAIAGADYTATDSTTTLSAGASTINIAVPIINDGLFEASENFSVGLNTIPNVANLVVLKSNAVVTINDDDPAPPSCSAQPMGLANGFNVFMLESMTQTNTDVEGKLAVGTHANLSNYSVGFNLTGSGTDVLVVGGNLTFAGGTVHHGNVAHGGTATLTNFSIPNGSTRRATPINFTTEGNTLKSRSTHFAGLPINGTTEVAGSKAITLRGSHAGLNVFNVTAADLAQATQLSFAVPATSSVIVNVTGSSATMQFFGFQLNGADKRKVLYNFAQATVLTMQGIGIEGSVLAPKAAVRFDNGQINGSLIGKSLNGTGQSNLSLFQGCLPIP
jgi:choice-of-anchor A domain-containing protein